MTLPTRTEDIVRLYDTGRSIAGISEDLGISRQAVHCRLKKAGYTPRQRRASVTKASVRTLRERMPDLVALLQFLEGDKRQLLRTIGQKPTADKLDRLGSLTDFIETLAEVTK